MFSSVSSWILSIAGIILLSVLVELLLPEGQMSRYIKGIFSFIVVFVVISPIPTLLNKEIDYSSIFNYEESFKIDEDYLYQLNLDKINAFKRDIEAEIEDNGYKNVSVYISADIFQSQMQIKKITVDIGSLVISENAEHNDIIKIKKHICAIIQAQTNLSQELILYDQ